MTQSFFERDYVDAHVDLSRLDRGTTSDGDLVIDLLMGNERFFRFSEPGICPKSLCAELSDHLPVWTTVRFDDAG